MYNSHASTGFQYLEPLDNLSGSRTILCAQGFLTIVISVLKRLSLKYSSLYGTQIASLLYKLLVID